MTGFVYGMANLAGLVILPREVAKEQASLVDLIECGTWGELRRQATPEQFEEILGLAGYGSFEDYTKYLAVGRLVPRAELAAAVSFLEEDKEWPDDEDLFEVRRIGAYSDGDWPPDPLYLMDQYLPREIIDEFGDEYETVFNGTFVRFDVDDREAILAALCALSHTCTEEQGLISRTQARW
jgi:hypothetical protein